MIEQYREKENLYMDRVVELEEATNQRDLKKKLLEDIKKKRQDEFTEGFMKITMKLKEMYQVTIKSHINVQDKEIKSTVHAS